jgi:hypothetical protein
MCCTFLILSRICGGLLFLRPFVLDFFTKQQPKFYFLRKTLDFGIMNSTGHKLPVQHRFKNVNPTSQKKNECLTCWGPNVQCM